jgi:hypothetical protein
MSDCWLAYRLHSLTDPITVSCCRSVVRLDHFKEHFRSVLLRAASVYPDAKVEEATSGVGLVLKTSKSLVPPRGRRCTVTYDAPDKPERSSSIGAAFRRFAQECLQPLTSLRNCRQRSPSTPAMRNIANPVSIGAPPRRARPDRTSVDAN